MRKLIWFSCGLVLCGAVGFLLAAIYVQRNPESMFARVVGGIHRACTNNPVVSFGQEASRRLGDQKSNKHVPTELTSPTCAAQAGAMAHTAMNELPPAKLVGVVTLPDLEIDFDGSLSNLEPLMGTEELAEWTPMEPLEAPQAAPQTMPYLEVEACRVGRVLCEHQDGDCCDECVPPVCDEPEATPECDHIYPHGPCAQPLVCPYTGKCYMPDPPVPHCQNPMEENKPSGEEPAEPMPMDDPAVTDPVCPDYHHGSMYHHGSPREVVCPYTGRSYPVDPEPCEPKTTEPEIKAEEQQEVPAVEQPKPEKKPEVKKKRKVRHKVYLLDESDATDRDGGDTLEFRPSDANPNEFGLIPF